MTDGVFDPGKSPRSSRGGAAVSGVSLSARRLREIETLLGVVIDPAADPAAPGGPDMMPGSMETESQALELLRAFNRITDPDTRREVLRLVQEAARGDRN
ncbi:hypothetical protein FF100_07240 [Methylobacterium terricola]|uniref:Uncharacterized protein n=1 Tax=Methylobacterium terricola TaxID=2583531 RepID=A0A5C4LML5_9HYPH|nr:hypothetical protein [Methylobacterium terricola]TNC15333.1 hypothetical protein FF100_07240 [Methylobacterium terricola]